MRYTGRRRIARFLKSHPDVSEPFACWIQTLSHVSWKTPADIRRTFRRCTLSDRIFITTVADKCKIAAGTFWEPREAHDCDVRVLKILTIEEHDAAVRAGQDPFARENLARPVTANEVVRAQNELGSSIVDSEISLDLADDVADAHYTDPAAFEFEVQRETFAITVLIEEYEGANYAIPIQLIHPADRLKFILDINGMNSLDLQELLDCSEFDAAECLSANKVLSQGQLQKLAEYFCLRPTFFGSANYLI